MIDGDYRTTHNTDRAFNNRYRTGGNRNPLKSVSGSLGRVVSSGILKVIGGVVGGMIWDIASAPSVGDATCPLGGCSTVQDKIIVTDLAKINHDTGRVSVARPTPATAGIGSGNNSGNGGIRTTFADPEDEDDGDDDGDDHDDPLHGDSDYVDLYKAPARGTANQLYERGFREADFPGSKGSIPDGNAYFGVGRTGLDIALDYTSRGGWDKAVLRVRVPRSDFMRLWGSKEFVGSHNGVPNSEVSIPKTMFDSLNGFARTLTWLE